MCSPVVGAAAACAGSAGAARLCRRMLLVGPVGIRRPSAQQGGLAGLSPPSGDVSHREGHHAYGVTPSGLRKAFMGWGERRSWPRQGVCYTQEDSADE